MIQYNSRKTRIICSSNKLNLTQFHLGVLNSSSLFITSFSTSQLFPKEHWLCTTITRLMFYRGRTCNISLLFSTQICGLLYHILNSFRTSGYKENPLHTLWPLAPSIQIKKVAAQREPFRSLTTVLSILSTPCLKRVPYI